LTKFLPQPNPSPVGYIKGHQKKRKKREKGEKIKEKDTYFLEVLQTRTGNEKIKN